MFLPSAALPSVTGCPLLYCCGWAGFFLPSGIANCVELCDGLLELDERSAVFFVVKNHTAMREVAPLVRQFMGELDTVEGDVIDIACGNGQNGLFVARRDHEAGRRDRKVVLLDRKIGDAVTCTADLPEAARELVVHQEVDLETAENPSPLPREAYGAALVFNYLHRPLMPNLRESVKPGGLVLYKTFTWEHPSVGAKPSNPLFLLGPGELRDELFAGWQVLHFFEGIETFEDTTNSCSRRAAVSSIVCRKPSLPISAEERP